MNIEIIFEIIHDICLIVGEIQFIVGNQNPVGFTKIYKLTVIGFEIDDLIID